VPAVGLSRNRFLARLPLLERHLEGLDRQGLIEWSRNGVPRKKIDLR
jgi:hypothetical protein